MRRLGLNVTGMPIHARAMCGPKSQNGIGVGSRRCEYLEAGVSPGRCEYSTALSPTVNANTQKNGAPSSENRKKVPSPWLTEQQQGRTRSPAPTRTARVTDGPEPWGVGRGRGVG